MLFIVDDRFIFHLLTYEIARFCICVLIILIICCYFRSSGSVTNPILQFAENMARFSAFEFSDQELLCWMDINS